MYHLGNPKTVTGMPMITPRLNVLLLADVPYYYNTVLDDALASHPHVKLVARQRQLERPDLDRKEINVLLVDPRVADYSKIEDFISWARNERGEVRCVFFGPKEVLGSFCLGTSGVFSNYITMTIDDKEGISAADPSLEIIVKKCRDDWVGYWIRRRQHDVALSYTNEDAQFVSELTQHLEARSMRVFNYKTTERLGENLREDTERIYSTDSRCCVLVASEAYRERYWCTKEAEAALQARGKKSSAHIFMIQIGNTILPGIEDLIYTNASEGASTIAERICRKLGYEIGR